MHRSNIPDIQSSANVAAYLPAFLTNQHINSGTTGRRNRSRPLPTSFPFFADPKGQISLDGGLFLACSMQENNNITSAI